MFDTLIITCEHAGNKVPEAYANLFRPYPSLLASHVGYDIGALELARNIADRLACPLYLTHTTRLLVDTNRSADNELDLFSVITKRLTDSEKQAIMHNFYDAYRQVVEQAIAIEINAGLSVLHISVHTFTPELHGEVRQTDIGLLYDTDRENETLFCNALAQALLQKSSAFIVKHNYPYLGIADGFTTYLRHLHPRAVYAGIELEVNQKYPQAEDHSAWDTLQNLMASAIAQVWKTLKN